MEYPINNTVPFQIDDFPQLQASSHVRQQAPNPRTQDPRNTAHWNKKPEIIQSQPTSSLEQIISKQSEKIDILVQQISTLVGLLKTLIAQNKK